MAEQQMAIADTMIKKGELITIATGEYSDYTVNGVFRANQDVVPQELIDRWLIAHPDQKPDYHADMREFLGWLTQQDLFEQLESREWHLGSYSTFNSTLT